MKHIHVVNPYGSAAMLRMTHPLITELPKLYEVTTSGEVDINADLNLHMPWHTLGGLETKGAGRHIIAYTHCNPPMIPALIDACERADLVTCMSFEGRRELVEMGIDPKKLWVIYAAADGFQYRQRLIGIVGYPQPNGRKRESLIMDLAWQYDLTPFQFVFVGGDWDEFVAQLQSMGVNAVSFHAETHDQIAEMYKRLDLLLVTGYIEGGPLPLLEAMASGVPVLSPRFGYAADLLDEEHTYNGIDELKDKLSDIIRKGTFYHQLARAWSWADYAAEYALLIGRLLGESVDLYPERGYSRYTQLLDVIDAERPAEIVEIGTWNGNRAIQMIQAAARHKPMGDIYYQGFDLFHMQTGEMYRREFSKQAWPVELVRRRLEATGADIELVEGDTNSTIRNMSYASLYFVDGGHSEETIANDAGYVLQLLGKVQKNEVAVFDDYYHAGKPEGVGCNKVIDNLNPNEYEVTHLPARTHADDGRVIGMVKVKRHAKLHIQMHEATYTTSVPYTITSGIGSSSALYLS